MPKQDSESNPKEPLLLTAAEVYKILRRSKARVYEMCQTWVLPHVYGPSSS